MLPLGRALVAPARPETVLRECRGSLEAGSAAAPALPCEVGDWKHSKLGDTHTHTESCASGFALSRELPQAYGADMEEQRDRFRSLCLR